MDTADRLFEMSQRLSEQATLPRFNVPAAIDVLALGKYLRLPTCIRDKIVPKPPLSPVKLKETIEKIDRLVSVKLFDEVSLMCYYLLMLMHTLFAETNRFFRIYKYNSRQEQVNCFF